MEEISYKNYAETGQLVGEISFKEFVKLYVNHRPVLGISRNQVQEAFGAFSKNRSDNPSLTSKQLLQVLYGGGRSDKLWGLSS